MTQSDDPGPADLGPADLGPANLGPADAGVGQRGLSGEAPGAAAPAPTSAAARRSAVLGVPINVVVSVGRARPMISELVSLRRDSVLPLDSAVEDPVELFIGERLIARGDLQELDDGSGRLAVRLTEIADLSDGV